MSLAREEPKGFARARDENVEGALIVRPSLT